VSAAEGKRAHANHLPELPGSAYEGIASVILEAAREIEDVSGEAADPSVPEGGAAR
jgi:hypothetical protein